MKTRKPSKISALRDYLTSIKAKTEGSSCSCCQKANDMAAEALKITKPKQP